MPPRGWKYSIAEKCYVPPPYWKELRKSLTEIFNKKRPSNMIQIGAGSTSKKSDKKYKNTTKRSSSTRGVEKTKFTKDTPPRDPMYTDDFQHYDPECGLSFKQCKQNKRAVCS